MKLKEFQKTLREKKIAGALFFSGDPNFFYFAQKDINNSFILIRGKGKIVLFTNRLEYVKMVVSVKKIISKKPYENLKKFLKNRKNTLIGINESLITVKQKKKLSKMMKTKDVTSIMVELRKTKTKKELANIRMACFLTEKILKKIVKNFSFHYENDIKKFIKIEAIKSSCELSFEPIVASGKNASIPHYVGNKKIKNGFLVIDMGLKYKGYCADITRTLYVGIPSDKEIKIYDKILRIQTNTIRKIKQGVNIRSLEEDVRKELGVYEKYFIHSLGHGLGIEVHEDPLVSIKSKEKLSDGMVITIEPGIYSDQGIRIEDDVLVTSKGSRLLTKFSKELIILRKP